MVPVVDSVCVLQEDTPQPGVLCLEGDDRVSADSANRFYLLFLLLVFRTQSLPAHPV